jgi:hypothetical protein
MVLVWRDLASAAGLPGLHIIYTLNEYVKTDNIFQSNITKYCDASFQFFPSIAAVYEVQGASSTARITTGKNDHLPQYWGGFSGSSSHQVTRDGANYPDSTQFSLNEFRTSVQTSFKAMGQSLPPTENQVNVPNLFFMTAWNEWNRQAVLEPSDQHHFAHLSAMKSTLESLPI